MSDFADITYSESESQPKPEVAPSGEYQAKIILLKSIKQGVVIGRLELYFKLMVETIVIIMSGLVFGVLMSKPEK